MEHLNATEAKRVFGDLLIKAQSEPISIIRNGKPIAVVVSNEEFSEFKTYKDQLQKASVIEFSNDCLNRKTPHAGNLFDWLKKKNNVSV